MAWPDPIIPKQLLSVSVCECRLILNVTAWWKWNIFLYRCSSVGNSKTANSALSQADKSYNHIRTLFQGLGEKRSTKCVRLCRILK